MDGLGDIESFFSNADAVLPAFQPPGPPELDQDVGDLINGVFGGLARPANTVELVRHVLIRYGYDNMEFCARLTTSEADARSIKYAILAELWPSCPNHDANPRRSFVDEFFKRAAELHAIAKEKAAEAVRLAAEVAERQRKSAAVLHRQLTYLLDHGDQARCDLATQVKKFFFDLNSDEYSPRASAFVNDEGRLRCPHNTCGHDRFYEWRYIGQIVASAVSTAEKQQPSHQRLLEHIASAHFGNSQLAVAVPGSTKPRSSPSTSVKRKDTSLEPGQQTLSDLMSKRARPSSEPQAGPTLPVPPPTSCF